MADYKVVMMLGENLASFIELSKKLLIDWELNPKKLLHFFQNIRKDELLGLIAGTHEIKEKIVEKQVEMKQTEKFALLADLGWITVPEDYVHGKCLEIFWKNNRSKFYGYNEKITDKNFPNPSRILKPGDKLQVRAFQQITSGRTTSGERMNFLSTQKAVHPGAQGCSLVFEQKRGLLPKGFRYSSSDEKDHLWKDSDGNRRVPNLIALSAGVFIWNLDCWSGDDAFFCFCD